MINIKDKHHGNISPDEQKEYIHVQVSNPTIHNTHDEGRFTTYQVTLKTNSLSFGLKYSVVDRRYSDFTWLRRALARTCDVKPPSLPFPGIIGTFRKRYLEERQHILTDFLQKVVRQTVFLSNTALHLFLQTRLGKKEMDAMLKDARRRGCMDCIRKAVSLYGAVHPYVSDTQPPEIISESLSTCSVGSCQEYSDSDEFNSSFCSTNNDRVIGHNNNTKLDENDWVIVCTTPSEEDLQNKHLIESTAYTNVTWLSPRGIDNLGGRKELVLTRRIQSDQIDISSRIYSVVDITQSNSLGTLTNCQSRLDAFPRSSSENALHNKLNRHSAPRSRANNPKVVNTGNPTDCLSSPPQENATKDNSLYSTPEETFQHCRTSNTNLVGNNLTEVQIHYSSDDENQNADPVHNLDPISEPVKNDQPDSAQSEVKAFINKESKAAERQLSSKVFRSFSAPKQHRQSTYFPRTSSLDSCLGNRSQCIKVTEPKLFGTDGRYKHQILV